MAYAYMFKIIMVGDTGVGKSSLLYRFIENEYKEISTTIGVEVMLEASCAASPPSLGLASSPSRASR
jgi:predicted GTPase